MESRAAISALDRPEATAVRTSRSRSVRLPSPTPCSRGRTELCRRTVSMSACVRPERTTATPAATMRTSAVSSLGVACRRGSRRLRRAGGVGEPLMACGRQNQYTRDAPSRPGRFGNRVKGGGGPRDAPDGFHARRVGDGAVHQNDVGVQFGAHANRVGPGRRFADDGQVGLWPPEACGALRRWRDWSLTTSTRSWWSSPCVRGPPVLPRQERARGPQAFAAPNCFVHFVDLRLAPVP